MRTVSIRSNGNPFDTRIRDKATGKLIDGIQRVEFSDLHLKTQRWVAILHIYTDEIYNNELVTEQEQVYVEIGATE